MFPDFLDALRYCIEEKYYSLSPEDEPSIDWYALSSHYQDETGVCFDWDTGHWFSVEDDKNDERFI